jgi:hypothetical protein
MFSRIIYDNKTFNLFTYPAEFNIIEELLGKDFCCSVAETHHFHAASAPGKIFDAAPDPALTLATFLKRTKV